MGEGEVQTIFKRSDPMPDEYSREFPLLGKPVIRLQWWNGRCIEFPYDHLLYEAGFTAFQDYWNSLRIIALR